MRLPRLRVIAIGALCGSAVSGCMADALIKQPELAIVPGAPAGWTITQNTPAIGTTITDVKSGGTAVYLSGAFQQELLSVTLAQYIKADDYRGKRVQLSAWVKPRNITNVVNSGIWMRVDGPGLTLGYDDMSPRPVVGYGDWRQVFVVMDVPANAMGIVFGALFKGSNTLLVDDMKLTIVGTDVPSTSTINTPIVGSDSVTTAARYQDSPRAPVNLDFENKTALRIKSSPLLPLPIFARG